jgi:cytochrome c-type biogenesis protein CcmE
VRLPRIAIVLGAAALIVAGVVLTRTLRGDDPTVTAAVLDVDQLATNPATFAGREVRLTGVVSAVQPEQQLFAVIDHAEYADCKVVTCSQYQIPINYAGDLPAVEASVTATGHLTQPEPGRYLFQATALELNP